MSENSKELILKGLIVLGGCAMAVCGLLFVLCFFPTCPEQIIITAFYISGAVWAVSGIGLIILMPIFRVLKSPTATADRFVSLYVNYDMLRHQIEQVLQQMGYNKFGEAVFDTGGTVILFLKEKPLQLHVFTLVSFTELTESNFAETNDRITEFLMQYRCTDKITDTVSVITLFCVSRVTPFFQKLMNTNVEQGFKNRRLPSGISFGSNTLYVARQKGGFAPAEYRRLRRELFEILEIADRPKGKLR